MNINFIHLKATILNYNKDIPELIYNPFYKIIIWIPAINKNKRNLKHIQVETYEKKKILIRPNIYVVWIRFNSLSHLLKDIMSNRESFIIWQKDVSFYKTSEKEVYKVHQFPADPKPDD